MRIASSSRPHGGRHADRRRWRLGRALAAGLLVAGCSDPAPPPNLVLITVDTLRPDRLACYGGPEHVGTGLCSLALRGARFEWAFAAAPSTAPSIASILTSQYPSTHAVRQRATSVLSDDQTSLAELLSDAGYATAAFVSNPVLARERQLDQGFEIYDDRMARRERNRELMERDAAATTDGALAWIRVTRSPWFLWLHYQDPHGPYDPPGSPLAAEPPGADLLPVLDDHSGHRGIPRYQALGGLRSPGSYERRYLDEVRYLDLHVARLVAGLDALGEPSAILLTADHGEAFGEDDYYFAHGHSLGLDQIRVPLLMRLPSDTPEPVVHVRPVSTLDVAPTLLQLAGLPVPSGFAGRPLPLSTEEGAEVERTLFAEHPLRLAAISEGGLYYARDRWPVEEPVRDPVSGGSLLAMPPRIARLTAGTAPPAYQPAGSVSLEAELQSFADAHPQREVVDATLAPGDLERLRALGYLE